MRAWVLMTVAALGCTPRDASHRVVPVVAPDGVAALHVSCGSDEGRCYRVAGSACPQGYYIQPTASRAAGNFLVRCRAPYTGWTQPASPPVAPVAPPAPPATASDAPVAHPDAGPVDPGATPWPPPEPAAPVEPWPAQDRVDVGY
jgi:hypothetical protein